MLSSIRSCYAGNDFAVRHRRFLYSIWFCCLASAVAIQETVLLSSIGVSCPASSTPISMPTTTYMLCTTGRQHQITSGGNRVDPRTAYAFQVRGVTNAGYTDWSESVTRICT